MAETGANIATLLQYENSLPGVKLTGYPAGLAQALYKMGFQSPKKQDEPGRLDDLARALESDDNVLYRKNVIGQQVPKRVEEYMEDRGDFVTGAISDYFLSPALRIINGFRQGYKSQEGDAERIIQGINNDFPLNVNTDEEPETPTTSPTSPEPETPGYPFSYGMNFNYNNPNFSNTYTVECQERKTSPRKTVNKRKRTTKTKSTAKSRGAQKGQGVTNKNTATANGNTVNVYTCATAENKYDDWLERYKELYF